MEQSETGRRSRNPIPIGIWKIIIGVVANILIKVLILTPRYIPMAGHKGMYKKYNTIAEILNWCGMYKEVWETLLQFFHCILQNSTAHKYQQ